MTGPTTATPAPAPHRATTPAYRPDGGARVVTGEPGCGRTWFLDRAARSFAAGRVVHLRADPARPPVPGAGLRTLLRALAEVTGRTVPLGATAGALLAALRAAPAPLLVCVDDAQLWDPVSRGALGAAAGRLARTPDVNLLLSVPGHRPPGPEFAGLPVLRVDPLSPPEAAALLDEATGGALDGGVRDGIVDAAEGNPALLLALVNRLSPAQLRGDRPLPGPSADARVLTDLVRVRLTGPAPHRHELLLTVAAAVRDTEDPVADLGLVQRAVRHLAVAVAVGGGDGGGGGDHNGAGDVARPGSGPVPLPVPDLLAAADGKVRFHSDLLRRAVYAGAPDGRRRDVHHALARELGPGTPRALLHRAWAGPVCGAELAAAAACLPSRSLRCAAYTRAAELSGDGPERAGRYTAAAGQALLAGHSHRALRLLDAARTGTATTGVRGRIELLRGTTLLYDGPVDEARASLLLAATLLAARAPGHAVTALLAACDAAWAAGDPAGCLRALGHHPEPVTDPPDGGGHRPGTGQGEGGDGHWFGARQGDDGDGHPFGVGQDDDGDGHRPGAGPGDAVREPGPGTPAPHRWSRNPEAVPSGHIDDLGREPGHDGPEHRTPGAHDYRLGLRALLEGRFEQAAPLLRRVVAEPGSPDPPEDALRAAAAALLLGDLDGARRAAARALAAARVLGTAAAVPRAREYLAYAELRAGRHALARTHAEQGLRAAHRTGRRNTAAHHHAVLALAASIEGDTEQVAAHVSAALTTARRHGLAQATTLAEWAAARADLGRGRPQEAADRLGPLVCPGPRRGHFAVWMLAVPCFVEAAVSAGQSAGARPVVEEFARWARFGADPQAPAQLLRCHALLAPPDRADTLYRQALDLHDTAGGDFERARTELLHGKWLRRRRRLREARDRLGSALVGFERGGARVWAEQTRGELRAGGAATGGPRTAGPAGLTGLTPQQLRIARRVAEGATNREVALTLSVSTRTVDYHLRKVFALLGVRSRVELARMVEQAEKSGASL
jgi:DNA-binding CsgD family transcriptional regulator/tetratricopeptide (TPR) repeat protein